MKTILSLSAVLATITALGVIPFAFADSKEMKEVKETALPRASEKAGSPAKTETPKVDQETVDSTRKVDSAEDKPEKLSAKSKANRGTEADRVPVAKLDLTPTQEDKLLTLLNEGTVEDLDAIPGIAMTRADSIVSARPYASVHEIILVEGVGNATFEKILAFGKTLTQRGSQADSSSQATTTARKS